MSGHHAGRTAAREWERAVLFGLVEQPSRWSLAAAALRRWALAVPVALLVVLGAPAAAAWANTYLVSNGNDSGPGSLRAAISLANRNPGPNTITSAPGVGQIVVNLQRALPRIGSEVIVQFSEGNPDQPLVINATGSASSPIPYGLVLGPGSDGSTLEGLSISDATRSAILVQSGLNEIKGIYYFFNHQSSQHGLILQGSNNTVTGNTVTGSSGGGILIQGPSGGTAAGNLIFGNTIGTDPSGDGGLGNLGGGVVLLNNTSGNTIGGSAAGEGNLISGNGNGGVLLTGSGATGNLIEGNTLGLTPSGSAALPNKFGIEVNGGAGNDTFTINTVAGNSAGGITINGGGSLQLQGNDIGTDPQTGAVLGNGGNGIVVSGGGTLNLIGGSAAGDGNLISGSPGYGVLLTGAGTGENTLQGNTIGTGPTTSAASANAWGVGITSGAVNDTLMANVITGNTKGGVELGGNGTSDNQLLGNDIGTDSAGDGLGNGGDGVLINGGASNNAIGGLSSGDGNTIAFNRGGGVALSGSTTTGDSLLGNSIFASGPNRSGPGIQLIRGANGGQQAPVIDSVTTMGGVTTITGTAAASATVQAFGNGSCSDPEGRTLLGTVTADSGGNWTITPLSVVPSGTGVTAAQTTINDDTSQFSTCVSSS